MRRYWINTKDIFQDKVNFHGDSFHHIFDVCRQQVGAKFEVLTEEAKAYLVEVLEVTKKTALAQIIETRQIPPLKEPHIHLALCLSRFPVMDAIMEKAVELGVKSIQPLFSDFSFVRTGEKLSPNKLERWDKIIVSATQQSGRGDLMKVLPVKTLQEHLKSINPAAGSVGLFAYEGESQVSIKDYVTNLKKSTTPRDIWIFIGSEGGFSDQEVQRLGTLGLHPVTLGNQVLRVETACMALVSVLKYDFDLMC